MMRSTCKQIEIAPIQRKPESQNQKITKSKLDNHITIKPSSGYQKEIDYRFETDEEIETQQYSQSRINKKNQQKNKNSFHNYVELNNVKPELNQIQRKSFKTHHAKLGFFHCDGLVIRSHAIKASTLNVLPEMIQFNSKKKSSQLDYESTPQLPQNIYPSNNEKSNMVQIKKFKKDKCLRANSIFTLKQKIKYHQKQNQSLPFALKQQQINKKCIPDDGFHIILQADQITQCCF